MKRFLAVAIITIGISFTLSAQEHSSRPSSTPSNTPAPANTPESSSWVKFTSPEGHFSVLMPETPQDKSETVDSAHGPYTTHLFIVKDTTNVYLIGWVDYDPSFNFNRQAELEATRDSCVKAISETLMSNHPTVIAGYSAIEFTAETADRVFTSRVFLVGRRSYQIVVGAAGGVGA